MAKEKTNAPPLYMPVENRVLAISFYGDRGRHAARHAPSSGFMVSVKLRRSAGSGKFVVIVEGRSSSVKSSEWIYSVQTFGLSI